MATVKLYPSTITTVLSWKNPDNAKADDGVYATTNGTRNSNHELNATGFAHSIPQGSIINSVTLEVQYKLSTTASAWTGSLIPMRNGTVDNGNAITTTTEPTTDTVWKNTTTGTWTLSEIETAGVLFRVRRSSNTACTYSVDYLAIIVDYTEPTIATIDVPVSIVDSVVFLEPAVATEIGVQLSVALMEAVPSLFEQPSLSTNNVIGISLLTAAGAMVEPHVGIYTVLLAPVLTASAEGLEPTKEVTAKIMTIDSLLNLVVLGEIVEGAVVNLDKYGVLTIVEIIEGSTFNLSPAGVLTVNSVTEGGI